MTLVSAPFGSAAPTPSAASLNGLDGINFFIGGMQAGFGPYVALYLADQNWMQEEIGLVLTAGGLAGLLSQLPGGELVDTARSKRMLIALGGLVVGVSAILIDFQPTFSLVLTGLVLQGITGGFLGPAIAAISLGLVGLASLPARLGRNQRFASIGGLAVTALMGLIVYFLSYQAIFVVVAILSLPMLAMLAQIRSTDIHFGRSCGAPDHHTIDQPARARRVSLWKTRGLLPFPVSTRQRLDTAACQRGSCLSGSKLCLTDHLSFDHPPADHRCRHGSMGRATSTKLGPSTAAARRARRFADPCGVVFVDHQSLAACRGSITRRGERSSGRRSNSSCHCRHYER